ncbi:threonine--tRNA ligase [Haliangium ochraceum]|uniref:Threonine--tRNA ligase n=1 Tax=Haliangium ochraceum (strain DSM 14365 / JCM 11303 / SMP-2) TaxID=502025 RepID=D0LSM8_HALO1|nr:threonine--tRNA ligase [Haliangium ochraceum]ACY17250.1 threonyl-tRNA synthetase [Haliangium ochraceum DSM 14365]
MPILTRHSEASEAEEQLHRIRHSTAHLMAAAVCTLWPDTKLAFGPPTGDGFYYDFLTEHRFSEQDFKAITKKMRELIKRDERFERREISKADALKLFEGQGEMLKAEHVGKLTDGEISLYETGEFVDLCSGPHVDSTRDLGHFKLTAVSSSYWLGDETREGLQRIYGTAWRTKEELKEHLRRLEEAKRRDHRVLGRDLKLFNFPELAGPGLPFYLPHGARMLQELKDWMWKLNISGDYGHPDKVYEPVSTPHILKTTAWSISGHLQNYRDNMFLVYSLDELDEGLLKPQEAAEAKEQAEAEADAAKELGLGNYGLKPMNCPGHIMMYKVGNKSYRDMPVRFFEFGTVYRYERTGTLHGLLRVRSFTQDDAHLFCTAEQLPDELAGAFDFCCFVLDTLGFDYYVALKTRGENTIGSDENWNLAEKALRDILEARAPGKYFVEEGDAAFYGPKVDFIIRDCLGREWQGGTVQLDFNLPERFDLEFVDENNQRQRPVMIHRAVFGSFERFFGLMVEEFGGAFPLWCAPVQVRVLPISDPYLDYARTVVAALRKQGLRVELDDGRDTLGKKIRNGKTQKVPYLVVVGENEATDNTVTVESYFDGRLGEVKTTDALIERMRDEIDRKVVPRKL